MMEEIKKALEGVRESSWQNDGHEVRRDGFYIATASRKGVARFIAAANPAAISELISTLESLQRENEGLREKADAREDELVAMLNSADESRVGQIRRAIIAESEAKVLRDIIRDNWGGRSWKPVSDAKATIILQALASTGGEHHAE